MDHLLQHTVHDSDQPGVSGKLTIKTSTLLLCYLATGTPQNIISQHEVIFLKYSTSLPCFSIFSGSLQKIKSFNKEISMSLCA